MKAKDIYRLTDPFLQSRGYTRKRNHYYKIKDSLAFCIVFEPVNGTLYCNYCMIPLYMPSENLYLTYGTRMETFTRYKLPPFSRDQRDDVCTTWIKSLIEWLDRRILPFFDRIDTPERLVRFLNRGHRAVKRYLFCTKEQYHHLRACTALVLGNDRRAEASIRASLREFDGHSTYTEAYKAKRRAELATLRALLAAPLTERARYVRETVSETQANLFPDTLIQ